MENIIVALTNYPALKAIDTAFGNNDPLTALLIGFAGSASFISHLVENHKHNMPGFFPNCSHKTSYLLNRVDVLGVVVLGIRVTSLYYHHYGISPIFFTRYPVFTGCLLLSCGLNLISERWDYVASRKKLFILTHSLWHLSIFSLLNIFLIKIGTPWIKIDPKLLLMNFNFYKNKQNLL